MATEVDRRAYLFTEGDVPACQMPPSDTLFSLRDKWKAGAEVDLSAPETNVDKPIFCHNPLHDMESAWWIALDFLINKERSLPTPEADTCSDTPHDTNNADEDRDIGLTDVDRIYARSVFYDPLERAVIMMENCAEFVGVLGNILSRIKFIGEGLLGLKNALMQRYKIMEANGPPVAKDACDPSLYQ